jgi:WD40 repeat protein
MAQRRASITLDGDPARRGSVGGAPAAARRASVSQSAADESSSSSAGRRGSVTAESAARRASIRMSITGAIQNTALSSERERRGSVSGSTAAAARRASINVGAISAFAAAGAAAGGGAGRPSASDEDGGGDGGDGGDGGAKRGRRKSFVDGPSPAGDASTGAAKGGRRGSNSWAPERRGSATGGGGGVGIASGTAARDRRGSAGGGLGKSADVTARGSLALLSNKNGDDFGVAAKGEEGRGGSSKRPPVLRVRHAAPLWVPATTLTQPFPSPPLPLPPPPFSPAFFSEAEAEALRQFNDFRAKQIKAKRSEESDIDVMTTRSHGFLSRLRDAHTLGVYSAHFADDGTHLASCSHDGSVIVWDVDAHAVKRKYEGHNGPVYQALFSPTGDNESLLTCSQDGTAKIWTKKSGRLVMTLDDHGRNPIYSACWSHDGSLVATAGDSRQLVVYSLDRLAAVVANPEGTSTDLLVLRIGAHPQNPDGHAGAIRRVVFSAHDDFLLSAGDDRVLRVWSLRRGGKLERELRGHYGAVHDICLSPQAGVRAVTASADGTAKVWLWKTGECVLTLKGHRGAVYSAVFTPEGGGRRIITGGHDKTICVWDANKGTLLQRMGGATHKSWVLGLSPRPDGLAFASASGDHTVGVWRSLPLTCWQSWGQCCSGMTGGGGGGAGAPSAAVRKAEKEAERASNAGTGGRAMGARLSGGGGGAKVAPTGQGKR